MNHRIASGLQKLGLMMRQQTWLQAHEEGLSPTQGQILAFVGADGPQSASELATRLGLSLPTISDSVQALVDKGYVVKKADPRHHRSRLLALTTKGRNRANKTKAWPEFLSGAVELLPAAEQEAFWGALVKLMTVLHSRGEVPPQRMCSTCVFFRPFAHGEPQPHHCACVDAPMAGRHLRLDCQEHREATTDRQGELCRLLTAVS